VFYSLVYAKGCVRAGKSHVRELNSVMSAQVPYEILDTDLPDDWECSGNAWDRAHASCTVAQELSDEEIDRILAQQVCLLSRPFLTAGHRAGQSRAQGCQGEHDHFTKAPLEQGGIGTPVTRDM
jgi:hypothetical protein